MRPLSGIPLLSALALLHLLPVAFATPLSPDESTLEIEQNALEKRCSNPCGYNGWLCCNAADTCITNSANQAQCIPPSTAGGGWEYFTTTYVVTATETDRSTITSVWSSHIATPAPTPGTCRVDLGQITCGSVCCDAAQECQNGECVGESSSAAASSAAATGEASPGVRGTSNGMSTVTQTAGPTITQGFIAPVGTNGADLIGVKASSSGGLSGGAIAGIVIGSIAGVILLFLICGCLCFKTALDALLAAIGIRKRRRRDTTYVEERYSHHSHGSRPRPSGGRTWFGTRPAESEVSEKKSKWSGWGTVAIILGALALCLGLRRRDKQSDDDDATSYTYPSSYYDYYSDYTRSSDGSDRRTRDSRRSRRSRTRSRRS